jgi:hypothetical protein
MAPRSLWSATTDGFVVRQPPIHTVEFFLRNLAAGNYSIRVNHAGFYPLLKLNYEVRDNLESNYFPVYLERCPSGNCDPLLRPKKPAAICE